jgi:hypothetical protein
VRFSLNLKAWSANSATNGPIWAQKESQSRRSDKHVGSGCATVALKRPTCSISLHLSHHDEQAHLLHWLPSYQAEREAGQSWLPVRAHERRYRLSQHERQEDPPRLTEHRPQRERAGVAVTVLAVPHTAYPSLLNLKPLARQRKWPCRRSTASSCPQRD